MKEKYYLEDGKFAAPRWLVYPELDPYTIGWRMGYGEDYALNEPSRSKEFEELFPQPKIWLFNPRKSKFKRLPLLGFLWDEDGKAKYSKIGDDFIEINDFIRIDDRKKFRYNHISFESIEHAYLASKVSFFYELKDEPTYEQLKNEFEFTQEQEEIWNTFCFTVLLNSSYYKIMQDENIKEKLVKTGDKTLIYKSDDEFGGEKNIFGFALMELRDEINRLYENEDLIDWEYTEYLKHKNPYEDYHPRSVNDRQSPEYRVVDTVLNQSSFYVRDLNLKEGLLEKYSIDQIVTEKAFVDATNKIGGIKTSHRYLILSNQMVDLSEFEKDTNWGIHVAKAGSRFKVLDICKNNGKTQIFLIQLPEGFEDAFTIENELIQEKILESRKLFGKYLDDEPIEDLDCEWMERVSFPVGMDDDGNLF